MIIMEPCFGKQGSMISLHHGSSAMVQTGASSTARFLLVDGHAYAYRAFYAIRQLNSPSGKATNAIYGFIKMLAKMQAQLQPSHLMIIWDGGLAEERKAFPVAALCTPATISSVLQQVLHPK